MPKVQTRESVLQVQFFRWLRYQYPKYKKLIFHVPNGGTRNAKEAANLKRQGVEPGVSDVIMLIPSASYHGLVIELKSDSGKLSDDQLKFLVDANEKGYLGVVCTTLESAMHVTVGYFLGLF